MKFTQLTKLAKQEIDRRGGVQAMTDQAKAEFERRGGTEGLKATAKQVADATKRASTPAEKAKAAADVLRAEAQRTDLPPRQIPPKRGK